MLNSRDDSNITEMERRVKYPRTAHLPWSPGSSSDDIRLQNSCHFEGKEVVVTEKLDGENTSLYADHLHARSTHSRPHPSREWIKQFHATFAFSIPAGWRLCGENLYACHSIFYEELESYFYLFSVWDDQNRCLDWDQTLLWAQLLQLKTPREFYRGVWNEKSISALSIDPERCEGYVVRTLEGFPYTAFDQHVAKWVRKSHLKTEASWRHQEVRINELKHDFI